MAVNCCYAAGVNTTIKLAPPLPSNHSEYLLDVGISAICDALELPKTINPYYKRQTKQTISVAQHMNTPLQTSVSPTSGRISTASRLNLLRETLLDGILGTDNNLAPELIHWIQHTLKPKYPKQYAALIGKLIPKTNEHIHENQTAPAVFVLGEQVTINQNHQNPQNPQQVSAEKQQSQQDSSQDIKTLEAHPIQTITLEPTIPTTRQLNNDLLFSNLSAEKEALYCHANATN